MLRLMGIMNLGLGLIGGRGLEIASDLGLNDLRYMMRMNNLEGRKRECEDFGRKASLIGIILPGLLLDLSRLVELRSRLRYLNS
jgi:hypothetical protein